MADEYYDDDDKAEEEVDHRNMLNIDDSMFLSDQSIDDLLSLQNGYKYPELFKALNRSKISNRGTCMIGNAVLKNLKLLTSETITNPSKIKRQRKFWREQEIKLHSGETKKLACIGFDGKQDIALVHDSKCCRSMKEEHYVIVSFPENKYVDHVGDVPNEVRKDLSTYQVNLLKACLTVQVGHDSSQYMPYLECNQLGNINHVRWLTKASRFLCFYVTENCIKIIAESS